MIQGLQELSIWISLIKAALLTNVRNHLPLCCISVRGIPTLLAGCEIDYAVDVSCITLPAWTLTHCILLYLQLNQLMESIIRNGMEEASAMVICPLSYSLVSNCTTLSHFDNQLVFHILLRNLSSECGNEIKQFLYLSGFIIAPCEPDILSQEVSEIDGRWCIRSGFNQRTSFEGLLLSRCVNILKSPTYWGLCK